MQLLWMSGFYLRGRMDKALYEKLLAVKNGDDPAFALLCEDYEALIESMTQSFFESCQNIDKDDLRQEARMALYRAAMKFSLDQDEVTFGLYAKICIRNKLISVRRKYTTQSKLKTKRNAEEVAARAEVTPSMPRRSFLTEEAMSLLSPFEQEVFALYAQKCSYSEIARTLSRSEKSIDNAIYRIKSKLRKHKE